MAADSGSVLALAAWLRALDDGALRELIVSRGVREAAVRDFFDLAEALLDPESVQAALARLDRRALALIVAAGDLTRADESPTVRRLADELGITEAEARSAAAAADRLGLLTVDGDGVTTWTPVAERLREWPVSGLPSPRELVDSVRTAPRTVPVPAAPVPAASASAIRVAADRAFTAVAAVTELVLAVRRERVRGVTRGGLAVPDLRRLSAATGADVDDVEALLGIAANAGLVRLDGMDWVEGGAAQEWLASSRRDRWTALSAGWLDGLPSGLRSALRDSAPVGWGDRLRDALAWRYPGGRDDAIAEARRRLGPAELLGVAVDGAPSVAGIALLSGGPEAAADLIAHGFPDEIERIYVQDDLSIIAPGPLRPDLESRLRAIADVETGGVASTFRISAASLDGALLDGETPDAIRAFLASISLTGIPQPLDYLIRHTATRFGTLRVGALGQTEGSARTYIRSDDAALLGQLAVDKSLAPLSLSRPGEHRILSPYPADVVHSALLDARYPAVVEDASGQIVRARPSRRPASGSGVPAADDPARLLVTRVRAAAADQPEEADRAWIARQLETAIKARATVTVTVRLPSGTTTRFLLEPGALSGGRLRARDRRSDIERTLPLASIESVSGD